jgi:putative heme-binding domain-containing protein
LSAASDKDASVRRQAIRQLGTRKVAAASSVLLRRLKDEDAAVRFQAATALGRIGKRSAVPALSRGLEQTDLFPRYAVFAALNRIGRQDPAAWREIAKGLESGSAALREGTEFALRETYDTALLDALVPIARNSHKPEPTREAALRLLAALHHQKPAWKGEWWAYHPVNAAPPAKTVEWPGTARVLQTLRAALDDSSARVRRAALAGLRDANDATASARLRELFTVETDPEARRLIVAALGVTKDAEARGLIASLLAPSTPRALLGEALTAAQNLAGPQIESALIQLLESGPGDNALLKQTLDSVGALKIARSVPALTNYAAHSSEEVRTAALRALLKVDTNKATLLILPLLDHASADVRRSATAALGSAKSRAVIPALLRAFADRETRSEAIVALAKTPSIEALEAYLDGLRHENPPVRDAARNAIRAIQEQALPLIEARASQLSLEALGALKQVYAKNERARELFAAAPKPIEPADYLAYALQSAGDAEVGRSLFHDGSRLACTKCHVVGSEGGRIGPDLTTAGAQFSRRELAESVLFPSRAMREGYQAVLIETREGESISGLFKSETADELSLTDSEGKPHHFRKADIAHRRLSELSLMPEGLQTGLTMQQFAGLISFLESLKPEAAAAMLNQPPPGFTALFNGRDLAGWKADANTAAHWRARDGVLEHDGVERDLWTQQSFGDFVLLVDWRWPDEPKWEESPIIGPDGNEVVGLDGKVKTERVLDAGDSGIFLRGYRKAQANLFCYPVGSGEVWEYRTDSKMPAEVRRAVTPKKKADKPVGAWNRMKITMEGDHLTVELNDEEVISSALLPGIPARGPIGFQHEHGRIQFRNMFVKELRLDR